MISLETIHLVLNLFGYVLIIVGYFIWYRIGLKRGRDLTDRHYAGLLEAKFLKAHNQAMWASGRKELMFNSFDELYEYAKAYNQENKTKGDDSVE